MMPPPSFDFSVLEPSAILWYRLLFEPLPSAKLLLAAEDWFAFEDGTGGGGGGEGACCVDNGSPRSPFSFGMKGFLVDGAAVVWLLIFVAVNAIASDDVVVEALCLRVAEVIAAAVVVVAMVVVVTVVVVMVMEVAVAVVLVIVVVVVVVVAVVSSPAYFTPQPSPSSHAWQLPDASQSPSSCVLPTTHGVPAAAISHVGPS